MARLGMSTFGGGLGLGRSMRRCGGMRLGGRCELAGVRELVLLAEEDSRLEDQRLFLNLAAAYARLEKLVERVRPEAIATLAYEGGHPDHDSCSVLGARLGEQFGVKVWEAPLYSRRVRRAGLGHRCGDGNIKRKSRNKVNCPTLAKEGGHGHPQRSSRRGASMLVQRFFARRG